MKSLCAGLLLVAATGVPALADRVWLDNGKYIDGIVIKDSPDEVYMQVSRDGFRRYPRDRVDRVERDGRSLSEIEATRGGGPAREVEPPGFVEKAVGVGGRTFFLLVFGFLAVNALAFWIAAFAAMSEQTDFITSLGVAGRFSFGVAVAGGILLALHWSGQMGRDDLPVAGGLVGLVFLGWLVRLLKFHYRVSFTRASLIAVVYAAVIVGGTWSSLEFWTVTADVREALLEGGRTGIVHD